MKEEKAVAPTEQGDLLGADVEVGGDPLILRTKDERRAKIVARIDEALRTDQLAPADAGSSAGTRTFMHTITFGKVGRKDGQRLHQRQHSVRGSNKLTLCCAAHSHSFRSGASRKSRSRVASTTSAAGGRDA